MRIREILQEELKWLKGKIVEQLRATGTTVTGQTADSIEVYIEGNEKEIEAYLLGRPAFSTVEKGRAAGGVPSNMVDIIRQWILDKGISVRQVPYIRQPSENWQPKYTVEERSLNMAAGAISHTIATKGTKLYREGGRADIYTPFIDEFLRRVEDKIYLEYKLEILERL